MLKLKKSFFLLCFIPIFLIFVGFQIVPFVLKEQIIKNLDENLTLKTQIEKVEFNPFTFKVKITNFKLLDEKENSFASLKELSIDFAFLKSIEKQHISFKNIFLDELILNITEEKDDSYNLTKILKPTEKEDSQKSENPSNIKFFISKIDLKNSIINFTSNKLNKPFVLNLKDINYTIYDLGTYKNSLSANDLRLKINEQNEVLIGGAFRFEPFNIYGKINISNLNLKQLLYFKKDLLNFDLNQEANLNLVLNYSLDTTKNFDLKLNSELFEINDINIKQHNNLIASLKKLDIKKFDFDFLNQTIKFDGININKLNSNIILDNNEINLATLIKNDSKNETKKDKNSKPWLINLSNIQANTTFKFEDKNNDLFIEAKPTKINLENLKIVDSKIDLNSLYINNSALDFENKTNEQNINSQNLNIKVENLKINKEKVFLDNLLFKASNLNFEDLNHTKIETKNLDLVIKNLSNEKNLLKIEKTDLNNPYISIILPKETKNEIEKNIQKQTKKDEKEVTKETKLDIGPININNGIFDFEDKNLAIPFKTTVTKLNGQISDINSEKTSTSKLKVDGIVDSYGVAKITGIVNPNNIKFLTDINLKFQNIAMENFTPYSGKFLGRELKSGKVDLDLKYNIEKSNLEAKNNITITKLELGKKIESSNAVSLPLDIAISLLKDSKGIININLPVSGNVDNPEFSIGSIVWNAFTNLITKAVTAPFSILAGIFNFNENEINHVKFEINEEKITPIQKETLDKIAQILTLKKDLAINISASYLKDKENESVGKNRILNIKEYLIKQKNINNKQIVLDENIINNSSFIEIKIKSLNP